MSVRLVDFHRRNVPRCRPKVWLVKWESGSFPGLTITAEEGKILFLSKVKFFFSSGFGIRDTGKLNFNNLFGMKYARDVCALGDVIYQNDLGILTVFSPQPPIKLNSGESFNVSFQGAGSLDGWIIIVIQGWEILSDESDTY
jgi:hypothetical protein